MSNFAQCGFANGVPLADLSSYVGAGSDLPLGAGAWVKGTYDYTGTFSVSAADRIYQISTTAAAWYTAAVAPPTANYTVQADFVYLTSAMASLGLLARAGVDSSYSTCSGYYLRHQTTVGFWLVRLDNGGTTTLSEIGHEVTSGTVTAQLKVQGSTITVYLGGVQVYQTTDSTYSAAGFAGVYSGPSAVTSTTGLHLANFAATPAVVVDTTPPVVASSAIASNGTSFSIVFTETGSPPVLPASGVTGLTLTASGGAVTIGSPTISGTTLSGTLSRTVYVGETVTLAYTPGNITDSATTPNALITFSGTSVTNSSTQVPGTFTVTETALPSNHGSGTITVHLVGTGTAWTSGTAFLVAGVSGWSVSSKTNVDATHTTLVLGCPAAASPPAGATGTLTITDTTDSISATTTVGTPTLAISPTSGQTGAGPSLTLTGTDTFWTTEAAAGLFTVTGGTGASIGTPTVTTNTAATVTLTVGSASGTLTLKDASTGAQASFTATVPPLTSGTLLLVSSGPSAISLFVFTATGGIPPYTYQWERNTDGGSYSNLSGATSFAVTDSTAVLGHLYGYRCVATDSESTPATVTSAAVTAQIYTGGALSGTVPSANDVRYGTAVGSTTGLLVVPPAANVLSGTTFDYDATAGTATVPTAAQVLASVTGYGAGGTALAGTVVQASAGDVRAGTNYGPSNGITGTCAVPTASQVLIGVSVDAATGTVTLPTAGQVESGITFGASLGSTGTYSSGGGYTLAQIAAAVWQDTTAGDFTAAGSPGAILAAIGGWAPVDTVTAVLASNGLDAIVVETGCNARQALSPILSAAAGVLTGAGTATPVFKNPAGTATRITGTIDTSGNRTASVLNLPA